MRKATSLKVPKIFGEKTISLAKKLKINDETLKIQSSKNFIYIPLISPFSKDNLRDINQKVKDYVVVKHSFPERKKRIKTFFELLEDRIPTRLLVKLSRTIDFVGNIAIIDIPIELEIYKKIIGEVILETYRHVQTVLSKESKIKGNYRLRKFNVIAGTNTTETIHREYGCKYHVDLTQVYFSPRLSFEHNRILSLVKEDETIVDLFAGVGPFSILIAKNRAKAKIFAVDLNPFAIKYIKKNILLNKVVNKVSPILGDAKLVVDKLLSGVVDRVIMNLPEKAIDYLDTAFKALKPKGGMIHFYSFIRSNDELESMNVKLIKTAEIFGKKVVYSSSRLVRETSPHRWQAVIDVKIINSLL